MGQVLAFLGVLGMRVVQGRFPYGGDPPADFRVHSDLAGGLKTALGMFEVDCGRYPATQEGLGVLISRPDNVSLKGWRGPYFDPPEVPRDPWGHEYVYRFPGVHNTNGFDLYSCGRDGVSKSDGNDLDDINNWNAGSPRDRIDWLNRDAQFDQARKLLFIIPSLFVVRVVAAIFYKRLRTLTIKNRLADAVWFLLSLLVVFTNCAGFIT